MSDIRITRVDNLDALWPRTNEWNALVERSPTNTVFQTLEWHRSWWSALGSDAQPLVLLAEAAGEIVGIAPLMLSVRRILGRKRRVVEFIGTHAADYSDFICDPARPAVVSLMLQWLSDRADRWEVLHLLNIAGTSPLLEALPKMFGQRGGYATELHLLSECPTRIFGDRSADLALLKKKTLRETYNKLRKQGRLEFRLYTDPAEIEACLEPFFQQHIDRWAGTGTPSFFTDDRQRSFYRELVRQLAPKGWIAFSVVSFNDIPLSFHFGYEYGQRIYFIKPTFNPEYRQYGPGMLQVKYLLEYAMQRDVKELDFAVGEEKYKYRFANHTRSNYVARVQPHSMSYGVDRLLLSAKALIERSPALSRLGRRLLMPWLGTTLGQRHARSER
jgi:CelD/BcsL family acetyltransferase involved in cellulose biosynthesis